MHWTLPLKLFPKSTMETSSPSLAVGAGGENDRVNLIKSIYPYDDIVQRIIAASEQGKLIIINKTKANEILERIGVQPSEREKIISLSADSLTQPRGNVKNDSTQNSKNDSKVERKSIDVDAFAKDDKTVKENVLCGVCLDFYLILNNRVSNCSI